MVDKHCWPTCTFSCHIRSCKTCKSEILRKVPSTGEFDLDRFAGNLGVLALGVFDLRVRRVPLRLVGPRSEGDTFWDTGEQFRDPLAAFWRAEIKYGFRSESSSMPISVAFRSKSSIRARRRVIVPESVFKLSSTNRMLLGNIFRPAKKKIRETW
eukprot:Gregarina_sp_Poly_1__1735@NODE_1447_length_4129_cov_139_623584_g959_i0_p5_GENE_NODE_1447_length_4129_cov_139_623584_g959_i0NODE_1447_length_4129_cov_139_623584_g959_i0_p5_ORF_typecomplete_len155_score18_08_NODE_1447_length_4129_cov_139_623584_g959_i019292393